jgi:hypothetical protein
MNDEEYAELADEVGREIVAALEAAGEYRMLSLLGTAPGTFRTVADAAIRTTLAWRDAQEPGIWDTIGPNLARIADALESPIAPVQSGRCGASMDEAIGFRTGPHRENLCCVLRAGHRGWHLEGETEWSN